MNKNTKLQKVVVTGGAGFIGSNLTDALIDEGYEVHVIDNLSGGSKKNVNKKAKLHTIDIRDLKKLKKIMQGARYVFHLAALPRVQYSIENPLETNEVNVVGTWNVFVAAKEAGVKRVVYAASSSAYGDQDVLPLLETMEARPKSPYGVQKYIGELYAKLAYDVYGLETVSLRYFNVYGPRLDPHGAYALVIGKFLQQRKEGKPITITGDGTQTRDFTHVRDVVRANMLAVKSKKVGKAEVVNIGAGNNQSINKIAELIGGPTKYIPVRFEPRDTRADISKAKKLLEWKPGVSIEEGIAELKKIFGI